MVHILAFLVLLGILVLAHELGHFLVARLLGVKAEVFSLGFGKAIFKKKVGDTEYRLSMVPVGGYVKFYGDDATVENPVPEEMKPYLFSTQKVWKRALIVFAGPLCNFILAVFVFAVVYFIGEPNIATKLGYVEQNSIAWNSGLREGDSVEKVNGVEVKTWMDLDNKVSEQKGIVDLLVKRDSDLLDVKVPLTNLIAKNRYGETEHRDQIQGISPFKRSSLVGISSDPKTLAKKAGLKTGDLIFKIKDKEIKSWDELELELKNNVGKIDIIVKRADKKGVEPKDIKLVLDVPAYSNVKGTTVLLGIYPSELFVSGFVDKKSPALNAGIKEGDRLYSVNGSLVLSFQSLQQIADLAGRNNQALKITVERAGEFLDFNITPSLHNLKEDEAGQKDKRFLLGIEVNFSPGPVEQTKIIIRNPIKLIWTSIEKTVFWIWITFVGLIKLVTGSVSFKAVGGPLMIGKVAGDSLMLGVVYFFRIMAVISINLGVINLFPVPVLDGGHLVLFSIEAIRKKPLKEKYIELAQKIGFYILMGLIVLSFYNDIIRFGAGLLGLVGK